MSRESHILSTLPETGAAQIPYKDNYELVRGTLRHAVEMFVGRVTGAGGAGGSVTGVPFQPAYVRVLNPAGAAPAVWDSIFTTADPVHMVTILAAATNATPPVLTRVGANNWTVALPTEIAPDAEVVTVLIYGFNEVAGSL